MFTRVVFKSWPLSLLFLVLTGLFSVGLFAGCSAGSLKPESYGAYMVQGNQLVQLREHSGPPDSYSGEGIPVTDNRVPELLLWHPAVDLPNLVIYHQEVGSQYAYDVAPGEEGVLHIRPIEPLPDGPVCLVQGNPFVSFYNLSNWCFVVQSAAGSAGDDDPEVTDTERVDSTADTASEADLSIDPPHNGFFIVIDGEAVELPMRTIGYLKFVMAESLPIVNTRMPVAITNLPLDVPSLYLFKGEGRVGIQWNEDSGYVILTDVDSDSPLSHVLQDNDIIVSVNGQAVSGNGDFLKEKIAQGPFGEHIELEVLRGTQSFNVAMERNPGAFIQPVPMGVNLKQTHVQLVPDLALDPGVYCYASSDRYSEDYGVTSDEAWCFRVQ